MRAARFTPTPAFTPTPPLTSLSCFTPTPRFAPTPGTIADQLRLQMLALDYPAFARCICSLLEALGYEQARPAGRREWKGYNRHGGGGYDLEAVLPGGLAPRRVIAQIKQFNSLRVHQRSVDELRGACLRAGATEGILVTTSAFSKVVQREQVVQNAQISSNTHTMHNVLVAPIQLIDGKELLTLLIRYRLGVQERGKGAAKRLTMDEAFFHALSTVTKAKDHKAGVHKAKECPERRAPLTPHGSPHQENPNQEGPDLPNEISLPKNLLSPKRFVPKRFVLPGCWVPRWRVTIHISSKGMSKEMSKDEALKKGGH